MAIIRDWQRNREMWIRVLEKQTGEGLEAWNTRVRQRPWSDERVLRRWLDSQGIRGYAQGLLVMERFGYPDFLRATAEQLVDAQYGDRPRLRPIYTAIVEAADALGEVIIQARRTYVSLVTPRRTFARVQPTTRSRVDLALRLDNQKPGGRLQPSRIHATMRVQIGLSAVSDVDAEVVTLLRRAYLENSAAVPKRGFGGHQSSAVATSAAH
jgi:hypothetical protein